MPPDDTPALAERLEQAKRDRDDAKHAARMMGDEDTNSNRNLAYWNGVVNGLIYAEEALRAVAAEPAAFKCGARKSHTDPPADCDWPTCGCDPYADKVIAALQEEGHMSDTPSEPRILALWHQLKAELERYVHGGRGTEGELYRKVVDLMNTFNRQAESPLRCNVSREACSDSRCVDHYGQAEPPATPAGTLSVEQILDIKRQHALGYGQVHVDELIKSHEVLREAASRRSAPQGEPRYTQAELNEACQVAIDRTLENVRSGSLDHKVRAQPASPTGWQGIESAPKDGTEVLLGRADALPHTTGRSWINRGWWWTEDDTSVGHWIMIGGKWEPTHWMPLPPAPPSTTQETR